MKPFEKLASCFHAIVATVAFGMGLDLPMYDKLNIGKHQQVWNPTCKRQEGREGWFVSYCLTLWKCKGAEYVH